jgi:predicted permease
MSAGESGFLNVLLRLLPSGFRERFATEISATFEARRADARRRGTLAVASLWIRTVIDLLGTAVVEWAKALRPFDARDDVRLAVRNLLRAPVFTLIAGTTIALGIGANTAVFSVVRAVLLQPLPVDAPEELVRIWSRNDPTGVSRSFVSPTNFLEMRREARTFADIGAWVDSESTILLGEEETPTRATLLAVTWSLPEVLGVEPLLGRSFVASDEDPNAPGGVLLPYGTWQRIYGGNPDVLSQPFRFLGADAPILGVLPPGLEWVLPPADVIVLLGGLEQNPARDDRWLSAIARLAPGVDKDTGEAEMAALAGAFATSNPQANQGWTYRVDSLDEVVLGETRPALLILLAAAGLVLLIACANVANLLLGRAEGRERDIALRTALGAGRRRIARLLITESLLLASVGALAGLLLAVGALDFLTGLGSAEVPRLDEVALDGSVLAFTALVTVVTGLVFGLAPAVRLMYVRPRAILRDGGRGSSGGKTRERVRSGFVVAQLALSVLLVISAGLLVRNLVAVLQTDPGFERTNLVTAELTLNTAPYPTYDEVRALYVQLADRARDIPQVRSIGLSTSVPFGTNHDYPVAMQVLGQPVSDPSQRPRAINRMVDEGFVETLGITLTAGRNFTALDDEDSEGVVIVNEAAARLFWGRADPVGESFTNAAGPFGPLGETQKDEVRVVGVVRDVRYDGLTAPPEPTVYFPFRQAPFRRMNVTLRTDGNPDGVLGALRGELKALDPSLPISGVATFEELVDRSIAQERLTSTLLGVFALLALALASVGIYGVLSHTVVRRMNEIGIRRALGADSGGVARLVMGKTLRLTSLGIGIGIAAAILAGQLLTSQLHAVGPRDPWVFGGVTVVLAAVSLVASVAPLVKALAIDPAVALRRD